MRIWSLHPKYLDSKGLVALWRETLLAKNVLEGKTKGYKNHSQLNRFKKSKNPIDSINQYLYAVYNEALERGYNFNKDKINRNFSHLNLTVTKGQLNFEIGHLLSKLKKRNRIKYNELNKLTTIDPHPMFNLVEGGIEDWEAIKNQMSKVLITGGTGLIGKYLCKKLHEKGYDVAILARKKKQITGLTVYNWNIEKKEIEKKALEKVSYIIHLAGANIGDKRWTRKRKQEIINSRIKTNELLLNKIKEQSINLKAFISASATGYYGMLSTDKIFIEEDSPANDFLGETCKQWEQSVDKFKNLDIRTVKIRTGVVLTSHGGALSKMLIPFKLGFGSTIGNGNQYMPWIHIDDLCNIYIKAIEDNQMKGSYNAVAPEHTTNKAFIRTLAHVLKKQFLFFKIPAIIMKLIFGEMAEILLKGSMVSSEKIKNAGYQFKYLSLISALNDLIK